MASFSLAGVLTGLLLAAISMHTNQNTGIRERSPNVSAILLEVLAQAVLQGGQLLLAPLATPELRLQRRDAPRHLHSMLPP